MPLTGNHRRPLRLSQARLTAPAGRAAPPAASRNARKASRQGTALPALITLPGLKFSVSAKVLDMSAGGARVQLLEAKGRIRTAEDLPDVISLVLVIDRVEVASQIKWRRGQQVGMRFTSAFRQVQLEELRRR